MIDTDKYEGHTPGPWLTKGSCPEEDPEFFTIVSDWEESVYCRVATVSTRWSAPMNEANARLIRAAPDLLAALIKEREESKRLREILHIAEQNIPRRIYWDCYIEALIEAGFQKGEEEEE